MTCSLQNISRFSRAGGGERFAKRGVNRLSHRHIVGKYYGFFFLFVNLLPFHRKRQNHNTRTVQWKKRDLLNLLVQSWMYSKSNERFMLRWCLVIFSGNANCVTGLLYIMREHLPINSLLSIVLQRSKYFAKFVRRNIVRSC